MKIALILITILSMTDYENYIGKHISEFPDFKEMVKIDREYSDYQINGKFKFFDENAESMVFETDDEDYIKSFRLFFSTTMKKELYLNMVEKYGTPDKMFKLGEIKETSKTVTDYYIANSTTGAPQDCTFDEVPLFIIWNHNNHLITVQKHPDNAHFTILFK